MQDKCSAARDTIFEQRIDAADLRYRIMETGQVKILRSQLPPKLTMRIDDSADFENFILCISTRRAHITFDVTYYTYISYYILYVHFMLHTTQNFILHITHKFHIMHKH